MRILDTPSLSEKYQSASPPKKNEVKSSFFAASTEPIAPFFGLNPIQPKLKIGSPDDKYEQQADRVAESVVNSPTTDLQMQPLEEEKMLQMKCKECEEESLQMKGDLTKIAIEAPDHISRQIQSAGGGSPLPDNINREMSQKIGADFSDVNIHTGSDAAGLSSVLGAKAFTVGKNIYFNEGQYNFQSVEGKRLLAHELVHTVQQSKGNLSRTILRQSNLQMPPNRGASLSEVKSYLACNACGNPSLYSRCASDLNDNALQILIDSGWQPNLQVSTSQARAAEIVAGIDYEIGNEYDIQVYLKVENLVSQARIVNFSPGDSKLHYPGHYPKASPMYQTILGEALKTFLSGKILKIPNEASMLNDVINVLRNDPDNTNIARVRIVVINQLSRQMNRDLQSNYNIGKRRHEQLKNLRRDNINFLTGKGYHSSKPVIQNAP